MKKKFLSLMMAAAVVATTSVSAFASTDATVNKDGGEVNVTITGSVNDKDDNPPQGTINVTIPTALAFTVNNKGEVEGTSLNVRNNGTEEVEIYAYQFVDGNGTAGIEMIKEASDMDNKKTSKVALNLRGNQGAVVFASEGNQIYDAKNLSQPVLASSGGVKISSLGKLGEQNTDTIKLTGTAGKDKEGATAFTEEFTVKLRVKKKTA